MNDLEKLSRLVRYYILFCTAKAGSGHPTSSLSATDLMVALFFEKLKFDGDNPNNIGNDRVIFSKGHATPLLYSLWAAAGKLSLEDLESYRKFGSELEGHPRPNFKYVDVATGSLGQGLSVGVGMALASRLNKTENKIYVLMGDSEFSEGSIWEALQIAGHYKLSNLVGILDVNRLGQSGETMLGHNVLQYEERIEEFGWETLVVDGHNFEEIRKAFDSISFEKPTMVIAKTIKGKGVSFLEDKEGWHGKALPQEDFEKAVLELGEIDKTARGEIAKPASGSKPGVSKEKGQKPEAKTNYKLGEEVATRKAWGNALAKLGDFDSNVVSLDGETSNSTFSEIFREKHPERYFEMYIAEQNMVGCALGMSKLGKVPFASTFAAFFTRAFDQIRMSAYSEPNLKLVGSHTGVSIGEDGPSQMGLEDIAMMRAVFGSVVLCPGDAVACEKLTFEAAKVDGLIYIRTNRPATAVIYKNEETFKIGGSKVVKSSSGDKVTIVACGVALSEALKAAEKLGGDGIGVRVLDAYSIKPIDEKTLKECAHETNNLVVTVEDHYFEGGLGDAVLNVFANDEKVKVFKLAVSKLPKSGKGDELLDFEGISASSIYDFVKNLHG